MFPLVGITYPEYGAVAFLNLIPKSEKAFGKPVLYAVPAVSVNIVPELFKYLALGNKVYPP